MYNSRQRARKSRLHQQHLSSLKSSLHDIRMILHACARPFRSHECILIKRIPYIARARFTCQTNHKKQPRGVSVSKDLQNAHKIMIFYRLYEVFRDAR